MKPIIFTVALLLGSCSLLQAQVSGNINYQNSNEQRQDLAFRNLGESLGPMAQLQGKEVLMMDIKGLMNAKADSYLAIFNVIQLGGTAAEAEKLLSDRIGPFLSTAREMGVREDQIYIDMVSFVPVYEISVEKKLFSKSYNEIPKGFEMQKNVHILFEDSKVLDRLVTAAAQQEIYDLVKVDYFVENTEGNINLLRQACIAQVKERLKAYRELEIAVDTVYRVVAEASRVFYPIERYKSYQAFSSPSIQALSKKGEVDQAPKPKTMYYEMLPYNNFDIILNPAMVEPSVQYSFNLKVQFFLEPPVREIPKEIVRQKEFIWLTPQGEVRNLKVD
ncbi:MAG: SIMPL domain-containing protein [Saprospirales bacterium]|nr:SIMPL domain-containing protein [Saprospirales bacterium]MBK8490170.1 SIMPL domain-containing protein [Saprospirales bacterium]